MKLHAEINTEASPLSKKENEVLRLLAEGVSRQQAAAILHRSFATINTHVNHILQKLDANNTAQAITIAFVDGILKAKKTLIWCLIITSAGNCFVPDKSYASDIAPDNILEAPGPAPVMPFNRLRIRTARGRSGTQLRLRTQTRKRED